MATPESRSSYGTSATAIRGGIVGDLWARWLHVSHLRVEEDLRGRVVGPAA